MQYEPKWGSGIDVSPTDLEDLYATDPDEIEEVLRWKDAEWDWKKVVDSEK